MKTIYRNLIILFVGGLFFMLASCKKDFLEIEPKGFLVAKFTKDYEQIMNAVDINQMFTASGYLGDEVAMQQRYFDAVGRRLQGLFRYEDRVYQPNELPDEITDELSYINRTYLFNKVINEVMDSEDGTEAQKKALQAEAKVGRAVAHLLFLNDFSLPYDAATASSTLGVPLLTEKDVNQRVFVRATLQESYDFVIQDLQEALPYLTVLTHRRKFSKATAEFYLGRTYLHMGRFDEARKHIDNVFLELEKANIPMALYDYTQVLAPGGEWGVDMDFGFGPSNKPFAAVNTELIYDVPASTLKFNAANAVVLSPQTADLFGATDFRILLYSDTELFGSFVFPAGMRRYPSILSNVGPTLPDLYLMRAELKARANDLAGASTDVEVLRKKRMTDEIEVPAAIRSNQKSLVKFIMDERIREFALTGLRWLDMRRLSVDPLYADLLTYKHELYDDDGNVVKTYTLRPERFALKFGERMISEHQGLVDNK